MSDNDTNPSNSKTCECCQQGQLKTFLDLGRQPLCDDLRLIGSGEVSMTFPTRLALCDVCLTAHQESSVPKHELFPETYHYRSRLTLDVLRGMESLVDELDRKVTLAGKTVVDVGSNDGSLLDIFAARGTQRTVGVEPTGAARDASSRHKIFQTFFDAETVEEILSSFGHPDIVTFTNVFAHIENLPQLIRNLSALMKKETLLVIENHYLGRVLAENQFDTFYHEHPRTYSVNSFEFIASSLGRELLSVEFPERYGGNIRVVIGPKTNAATHHQLSRLKRDEFLTIPRDASLLQGIVESWKIEKREAIVSLAEKFGPLKAKAFPGRASILVNLLEIDRTEIECVYERSESPKIGYLIPGTEIPIRNEEELWPSIGDLPVLINFAWHIRQEIETYLANMGFAGKLEALM